MRNQKEAPIALTVASSDREAPVGLGHTTADSRSGPATAYHAYARDGFGAGVNVASFAAKNAHLLA